LPTTEFVKIKIVYLYKQPHHQKHKIPEIQSHQRCRYLQEEETKINALRGNLNTSKKPPHEPAAQNDQ
jgi:hypothetical protein